MSLKPKKRIKKLVSILATSMPVTVTREEIVKTTRVIGANRADEDNKGGEYLETNLTQILCIWYSITF